MTDLIAAHRSVLEASITIVDTVTPADLDRSTPCAAWTLRDLLAHMIGQNYGFAAAADGTGHDVAAYAPRPIGDEPAKQYAASAVHVIRAFSVPRLVDRPMYLAEIRGGIELPGRIAVGFHLVDYVAHGWDVAKTFGSVPKFDDAALQIALEVATNIPAESKTDDVRSAFAPDVATASTELLDQVVARLGRRPDWTPAD